MPLIKINSELFDTLEATANLPQVVLDYQSELDILNSGEPASDPVVLQLSSTLIRIQQDMWIWNGTDQVVDSYELRISGVGLKPVSSMDALIDAINSGLATGTLGKFAILSDGVEILSLSLGAAGYVLASGSQSVTLSGHLPFTFTQFYDMADLFDQVVNIDFLSRAERHTLFTDLAAYSVTGLTLKDGSATLFSVQISATTASITLNGLTISLTGTFPDNLGEDINLLWDAAATARTTGDVSALLAFTQADLSVTSVQITNAAGKVLVLVNDPLADTPVTYKLDGKAFDEVRMGDMSDDVLNGLGGSVRSVLAGLGGSDALNGFAASDWLYGGTGNDKLNGGLSSDRLFGGQGRDALTGGLNRDVFVFSLGDGTDRITDFTLGEDVISIVAANRLGDLDFTKIGSDVQINFGNVHILVEDTTIALLRQVDNFQF